MLTGIRFANPFPPYSLQKRPKPQICPKFVPAIVLGGSSQRDWNLEKFVKIWKSVIFGFSTFDTFFQISVPLTGTPQTIAGTNFGQIWGFGRFWRLQGGKGFANLRCNGFLKVPVSGTGICQKVFRRLLLFKMLASSCRTPQLVGNF